MSPEKKKRLPPLSSAPPAGLAGQLIIRTCVLCKANNKPSQWPQRTPRKPLRCPRCQSPLWETGRRPD